MTSTPSQEDPDLGDGSWARRRGTIGDLPRSGDVVEADIRAALDPQSGSPPERGTEGRHVAAGNDELGGLDRDERRERLARMLHDKIGLDPLTAPLSMLEAYDGAEPTSLPTPEPEPTTETEPVPEPEPVPGPEAPGAESVDVFAALRGTEGGTETGERSQTTTSPAQTGEEHATPPCHDADAVVLSPLHERLGTRDRDTTARPTPAAPDSRPDPRPNPTTPGEDPVKRKQPADPGPSPITQLSAMFEPHWDPEESEPADPVDEGGEEQGLDVGRRPTCSTDGPQQQVEFAPRRGIQRIMLVLLLVAFAGLCLTAWTAWEDRTPTSIAVAAFFGLVTLVLWSAHSRAVPAKVVVEGGVLTVTRRETRNIFDLKSSYTPIEAVGTPGRRDWKVLITRRSMDPFVIDGSMVDAHEFMRVLEHHRPVGPQGESV